MKLIFWGSLILLLISCQPEMILEDKTRIGYAVLHMPLDSSDYTVTYNCEFFRVNNIHDTTMFQVWRNDSLINEYFGNEKVPLPENPGVLEILIYEYYSTHQIIYSKKFYFDTKFWCSGE